jgi:hypothetical protein
MRNIASLLLYVLPVSSIEVVRSGNSKSSKLQVKSMRFTITAAIFSYELGAVLTDVVKLVAEISRCLVDSWSYHRNVQ